MKGETKLGWEGLNGQKATEAKTEAPSVHKWEGLFKHKEEE